MGAEVDGCDEVARILGGENSSLSSFLFYPANQIHLVHGGWVQRAAMLPRLLGPRLRG